MLIMIYIVNPDILIRKKTWDFLAGFLHFYGYTAYISYIETTGFFKIIL
jgi:hypothetical protein